MHAAVVDTAQAVVFDAIPTGQATATWIADHAYPVTLPDVASGLMLRVWDGGTGVQRPFQGSVIC